MHNTEKTVDELHALLIEYEKAAKGEGKRKGKGKNKLVYAPKPKKPKPAAKEHPTKDDACHHFKEVGHCRKNCHVYLAELMKKKKNVGAASTSSIFTIELFSFPNKSWVYDTGCGYHICNTKQGLRGKMMLKQRAVYLYVINEVGKQSLGDLNEHANYKATLLDRESNKWFDAMNAKMQSMKDNQIWRLVDLPPNGKTVGIKWLFKKKTDMDGSVHTYKACLVAKSSTQTYRIDYEKTFSPVTDIRAIKFPIAKASFYDYEIWQIDIKATFLNGYLDEDIYMVKLKVLLILNISEKLDILKEDLVYLSLWKSLSLCLSFLDS
nr:putative retrotransposon Ty1-copia subclass protein [Tanacetum cinerariifolium]